MIEDLKDLKQLFKLCRAQGITDFKMNGIEIKFGDIPTTRAISEDELTGFPDGELSPEQLMFYSAGGKPDDDPVLKGAS